MSGQEDCTILLCLLDASPQSAARGRVKPSRWLIQIGAKWPADHLQARNISSDIHKNDLYALALPKEGIHVSLGMPQEICRLVNRQGAPRIFSRVAPTYNEIQCLVTQV